jgi:hypothetical protein
MSDISAILSGQYQSIELYGQRDGNYQRAFPGLPETNSQNGSVSVEISNVGKAMGGIGNEALTEAEQKQVKELQARDNEVRNHERAHIAAGGGLVRGGASYQYKAGPDGHLYAIAGEVTIDTSAVPNDPDATIRKAQQIKRAATAPADPSGQDRSVASEAEAMEAKARQEKSARQAETGLAVQSSSNMGSVENKNNSIHNSAAFSKAIFG